VLELEALNAQSKVSIEEDRKKIREEAYLEAKSAVTASLLPLVPSLASGLFNVIIHSNNIFILIFINVCKPICTRLHALACPRHNSCIHIDTRMCALFYSTFLFLSRSYVLLLFDRYARATVYLLKP
jgi:hypothetical protein